jgi:hypothetical protein
MVCFLACHFDEPLCGEEKSFHAIEDFSPKNGSK